MTATDSVHDVVSLADCRADIEEGGHIGALAMERVATYLRQALDDSVSIHISYAVEEGVGRDGNREYRTDFERIQNIEIVARTFDNLDSEVLRKVHLATGLTAETEYEDSMFGQSVFRYRLTNN